MGVKRWILVIFIIAVVSSLLALLFLQSGVDEQIIEGLIPKVEERLGVEVEFEEVDVSLSSVKFAGVRVMPAGGGRPFAVIRSLGVGVKVGPLLLGELDLTGVRMDGLEIRMGQPADGASPAQWQNLFGILKKRGSGTGDGNPNRLPEVHVVSGRLAADDGRFSMTVEGISGRVSLASGAVVTTDDFTLSGGGKNVVQGDSAELVYRPEGRRGTLELDRPDFEVVVGGGALEKLLSDLEASFAELGMTDGGPFVSETPDAGAGGATDRESEEDGGPAGSDADWGTWRVSFRESEGALLSSTNKGQRVQLTSVTGEMTLEEDRSVSFRAAGGFHGTDARWSVGAAWKANENPTFSLEVPEMPLARFGHLLSDSEHIDWSKSFADGKLEVEIGRGGEEISVEGQVTVSGLGVSHPRLASKPMSGLDAHLDFKVAWERAENRLVLERMLISRGLARATLRGFARLDRMAFDLSLNVPPTACRQVLAAIPKELRDEVRGAQLEGQFGLDLRLGVDVEAPEDTALDVSVDNRCRITDYGDLPYPDQFRRPFSYTAYSESGEDLRLISGPGTDRWTPLSMISPYVVEAALTTEDGKFRHHLGVTVPELRRAIELNLTKDDLSHGASTITMQLAKNLFLTRERTVARKLQELFFTWYLESYFSKDEILELYLNVIEFGPSLYGITEAADHYFGRLPHELNLVESVFLIKLLPNPVLRHSTYVRGEVSERKLASLRRVMKTMRARGRISKGEFTEGMSQTLLFHHEGDPLPEPRTPIARGGGLRVLDDAETYDEDEEASSEPEWGVPVPAQ